VCVWGRDILSGSAVGRTYVSPRVALSSYYNPANAHYLNNRFVRSDQISVTLSSVPAQRFLIAVIEILWG